MSLNMYSELLVDWETSTSVEGAALGWSFLHHEPQLSATVVGGGWCRKVATDSGIYVEYLFMLFDKQAYFFPFTDLTYLGRQRPQLLLAIGLTGHLDVYQIGAKRVHLYINKHRLLTR